ncbi:hypothetical protein FB45DRAFT_1141916 [Roridomyces roridus]|uniref:Novel STAND NTPase 1 domain-containing protein n=1 Tax=Roridomyces roridus TaxID=1738132 RepID=A0AAD7BZ80_9AGAR|nr:hypothetical protein FB45DRAFT_1141916 [Roridomyces roridus]
MTRAKEKSLRLTAAALESLAGVSPIPLTPLVVVGKAILAATEKALQNTDNCHKLAIRVAELVTALINETAGRPITPQLQWQIDALLQTLESIHAFIQKQQSRSFARRLWSSNPDNELIQDLNAQLDQALDVFNLKANIIVRQQLETIIKALEDPAPQQHHPRSSSFGSSSGFSKISSASSLPSEPNIFFGRDELKEQLLKVLVDSEAPSRVAILGPGGVGKTSLALVALHSNASKETFGDRRYFVRCDAANTSQQLLSAIATELNLGGNDLLAQIVESFQLEEQRALLMLDNFESPWDTPDRRPVEEVLNQLASLKNLVLVVTLRGSERPGGPQWTRPFLPPLKPLDPISAKLMFEAISDAQTDDSDVGRLLSHLDNLPLAINLMATLAQYESPSVLLERWDSEHTQMLTTDGEDRLGSLETSINVSLEASRMRQDPQAKTLLGIMAYLPDGVSSLKHLHGLAPSLTQVGRAASTLKQVALAFSDERCHLAVLAPIRSFIRARHPPPRACLLDVRKYYGELATVAAGLEAGADGLAALRLLMPEVGNMQATLNDALSEEESIPTEEMIQAAVNSTDLFRYSGLGDATTLENAAAAARRLGNTSLEARCLQHLGQLFYSRSDPTAALLTFTNAMQLYEGLGDKSGHGRCLMMLGMLDSGTGQYQESASKILRAQELFKEGGDELGLADCYLRFAQAAAWDHDYDVAQTNVEKALEIYTSHSHLRAQARCQAELKHAAQTYHDVGDPTGEGNCQRILGKLYFAHHQLGAAEDCLAKAIDNYQRVKWKFGLADCQEALGDVHQAQYADEAARVAFHEALQIFRELNNRRQQAYCLGRLFDVALGMQDFVEAQALCDELGEMAKGNDDRARHACVAARLALATGKTNVDGSLQDALATLPNDAVFQKDRALCLETLGDALSQRDAEAGLVRFTEAKDLYGEANDLRSVGRVLLKMCRMPETTVQIRRERASAALEAFQAAHDEKGCAECRSLLEE